MLRFFRLIRRKLLEEQKVRTYFYYALGEIFLVVIGILIALQINNWNEARKDRQEELAYLISFKIDLEHNLDELDRVIRESQIDAGKTDSLLRVMQGDIEMDDLKALNQLIFEATGYTTFLSQEGTIQNILGSGSLNVISQMEVRSAISTWEGGLKLIRGWEDESKGSFADYIDYMKANIPMYKILRGEPMLNNRNWRARVSDDLLFINILQERIMISGILNGMYAEKKAEIEDLIVVVDAEIERLQ